MKKYFVLLILSFVLVSCNKTETQPITEKPKTIQEKVVENKEKIVVENNAVSNTGEIIESWSWVTEDDLVSNEKNEDLMNKKWRYLKYNSLPDFFSLSYNYNNWKIFYRNSEINWANYDKFQISIGFNWELAKDDKYVYMHWEILEWADLDTIQNVWIYWGIWEMFLVIKDKNNVYTSWIHNLNIDNKTKNYQYWKDFRFDATSFYLDEWNSYFIDKNWKYLQSDLNLNKIWEVNSITETTNNIKWLNYENSKLWFSFSYPEKAYMQTKCWSEDMELVDLKVFENWNKFAIWYSKKLDNCKLVDVKNINWSDFEDNYWKMQFEVYKDIDSKKSFLWVFDKKNICMIDSSNTIKINNLNKINWEYVLVKMNEKAISKEDLECMNSTHYTKERKCNINRFECTDIGLLSYYTDYKIWIKRLFLSQDWYRLQKYNSYQETFEKWWYENDIEASFKFY